MTAAEIRQSFLDFFREKQHTLVPSASLLPQSPGLLFTNAGMNQFVPYFLGTEKAPYAPPRAADTQKCIRAGGKHNDLDDVGYDTYHHTFFEMLGNWSFGDYFKKEAIEWAWELVVGRWGFPANRLYASVYAPKPGDPGEFDQEAWDFWAALFRSKGCDPNIQIVHGNVKDNFWMMGETGPCGPCSELHVDLTPNGDSMGKLVNMDSDRCIEIWNLVFIQYNAEADGSFRELPSKHVDTGMGFERACSIIQNTKGFTDFGPKPSNYATDVFQPIFRQLEALSGKTYTDIYPEPGQDRAGYSDELKTAVAFRVIADHLRTLSFSIADGIMPGNNGRNYVLRRILRRAVRYGRQLGFSGEKPFFGALVGTLAAQMGGVFPELATREQAVRATLEQEEASFNQTLDRGLKRFEDAMDNVANSVLSGDVAFELYDTFGFPADLTELLCLERGLTVDMPRFEALMDQQRERARAAQKSTIVRALDISTDAATEFVGFDSSEVEATVLEVHPQEDALFVITDKTPFYAEMGGQTGDTGSAIFSNTEVAVTGVQQIGKARAHILAPCAVAVGDKITLRIDPARRQPIEAHHTATHLLHWALHQEVSADAQQQGSMVNEERLRFDFNSGAVSPEQVEAMEARVNACIAADEPVSWKEVPHAEVKGRADVMQFFGDKYGERVRVVQIGGTPQGLDGYSMELCGGTHVRRTGEIGLFKIKSEGAIAAGVRRIEAATGDAARAWLREQAAAFATELASLEQKLAAANNQLASIGEPAEAAPHLNGGTHAVLLANSGIAAIHQAERDLRAYRDALKEAAIEAEKRVKKVRAASAGREADAALAELTAAGGHLVAAFEGDAGLLQELFNGLKKRGFDQAAFLVVNDGEKLHLGAYCGSAAQAAGHNAGSLIQNLGPIAGGRGGGKPDMARGAGSDLARADDLLAAARSALGL
jgi:alanyl-tRNA synthetase